MIEHGSFKTGNEILNFNKLKMLTKGNIYKLVHPIMPTF